MNTDQHHNARWVPSHQPYPAYESQHAYPGHDQQRSGYGVHERPADYGLQASYQGWEHQDYHPDLYYHSHAGPSQPQYSHQRNYRHRTEPVQPSARTRQPGEFSSGRRYFSEARHHRGQSSDGDREGIEDERAVESYLPPHRRDRNPAVGMRKKESRDPLDSFNTPRASPGPRSAKAFTVTLPSPEYIALSEEPMFPTPKPLAAQTKLLVLDLNGALIYRDAGSGERRKSYPRPYLQCFLDYLFLPDVPSTAQTDGTTQDTNEGGQQEPPRRPWDVFVWSSAQPHNVRAMVENSFGEKYVTGIWQDEEPEEKQARRERGEGRLLGVWARDKLNLSHHDYRNKVQTVKDLRHLISNLNKQHEVSDDAYLAQLSFSERNTVLLDDSPLKAIHQPWNQIMIPEYDKSGYSVAKAVAARQKREADHSTNRDARDQSPFDTDMDDALLCVIGILEEMISVQNVPAWVRRGGLVPSPANMIAGAESSETVIEAPTLETLPSSSTFAHWYTVPSAHQHWLEKGKAALARRGIDCRHGIDPDAPGLAGGASPYRAGRNLNPATSTSIKPPRGRRGLTTGESLDEVEEEHAPDSTAAKTSSEAKSNPKPSRRRGWSPSRPASRSPSTTPEPQPTAEVDEKIVHRQPKPARRATKETSTGSTAKHPLQSRPAGPIGRPTPVDFWRSTFPAYHVSSFLIDAADYPNAVLTEAQRNMLRCAAGILDLPGMIPTMIAGVTELAHPSREGIYQVEAEEQEEEEIWIEDDGQGWPVEEIRQLAGRYVSGGGAEGETGSSAAATWFTDLEGDRRDHDQEEDHENDYVRWRGISGGVLKEMTVIPNSESRRKRLMVEDERQKPPAKRSKQAGNLLDPENSSAPAGRQGLTLGGLTDEDKKRLLQLELELETLLRRQYAQEVRGLSLTRRQRDRLLELEACLSPSHQRGDPPRFHKMPKLSKKEKRLQRQREREEQADRDYLRLQQDVEEAEAEAEQQRYREQQLFGTGSFLAETRSGPTSEECAERNGSQNERRRTRCDQLIQSFDTLKALILSEIHSLRNPPPHRPPMDNIWGIKSDARPLIARHDQLRVWNWHMHKLVEKMTSYSSDVRMWEALEEIRQSEVPGDGFIKALASKASAVSISGSALGVMPPNGPSPSEPTPRLISGNATPSIGSSTALFLAPSSPSLVSSSPYGPIVNGLQRALKYSKPLLDTAITKLDDEKVLSQMLKTDLTAALNQEALSAVADVVIANERGLREIQDAVRVMKQGTPGELAFLILKQPAHGSRHPGAQRLTLQFWLDAHHPRMAAVRSLIDSSRLSTHYATAIHTYASTQGSHKRRDALAPTVASAEVKRILVARRSGLPYPRLQPPEPPSQHQLSQTQASGNEEPPTAAFWKEVLRPKHHPLPSKPNLDPLPVRRTQRRSDDSEQAIILGSVQGPSGLRSSARLAGNSSVSSTPRSGQATRRLSVRQLVQPPTYSGRRTGGIGPTRDDLVAMFGSNDNTPALGAPGDDGAAERHTGGKEDHEALVGCAATGLPPVVRSHPHGVIDS